MGTMRPREVKCTLPCRKWRSGRVCFWSMIHHGHLVVLSLLPIPQSKGQACSFILQLPPAWEEPSPLQRRRLGNRVLTFRLEEKMEQIFRPFCSHGVFFFLNELKCRFHIIFYVPKNVWSFCAVSSKWRSIRANFLFPFPGAEIKNVSPKIVTDFLLHHKYICLWVETTGILWEMFSFFSIMSLVYAIELLCNLGSV